MQLSSFGVGGRNQLEVQLLHPAREIAVVCGRKLKSKLLPVVHRDLGSHGSQETTASGVPGAIFPVNGQSNGQDQSCGGESAGNHVATQKQMVGPRLFSFSSEVLFAQRLKLLKSYLAQKLASIKPCDSVI